MTWQTLKWRVAARGFGLSLVPAWERSLQDIEASPPHRPGGSLYVSTWSWRRYCLIPWPHGRPPWTPWLEELKLGRLGLYPGAPERGLAGDLTAAIGDRVSLRRDDTLFVVPATRNGGTDIGFAFATADQLLR